MTPPCTITFVVPVYNERNTLERLAEGIDAHAVPWAHDILFVDDGSTDGSYEVLCALHERLPTVGILRFEANAGKTQALAAGFAHARGDVFVTMDADLQDDPAEIPKLLGKLFEGHDVVCGWKSDRQDPWHKTLPSRVYNFYIARTFGIRLHDVNTGFKAMRAEAARSVPLFGDMHRLIPIFARHAGYDVTEVAVRHHPRRHGISKYGPERFLHGLRDIARARLLTRFRGSVLPYVERALLWTAAGLGAAALADWAGGLPPIVRWTLAGTFDAVCAGIVLHCLYMVRIGPGIVRHAANAPLEAKICDVRPARAAHPGQVSASMERTAHQS